MAEPLYRRSLRTPLNAIVGFAEVIESGILGTAQTKQMGVDYGCDINAAGNHLLKVINEILDIAQIEAGNPEKTLASLLDGSMGSDFVFIAPLVVSCSTGSAPTSLRGR